MAFDIATLWAATEEDRKTALEENQREINEIVATLPLRSEKNRDETIQFLKSRGIANQFSVANVKSSQQ
jgi:hypothetical protein